MQIGYTLSSEEHLPNNLVKYAGLAEKAGFDFLSISDHFHPWLDSQGQSPFVWNVLGGISQVTSKVKVMTGVTCPILRYNPVIIAQAAATTQVMMDGRFMLGVGTGENLNEHVVGMGWPEIDIRREMLDESIELMRQLWQGGMQTFYGHYFEAIDAQIYTLPEKEIPIIYAAAGKNSASSAGKLGDALVTAGINNEAIDSFKSSGGEGKDIYGQMDVCWAKTEDEAKDIVTKTWPLSAFPDPANSEYRLPLYFQNLADALPEDKKVGRAVLGQNVEGVLESIKNYTDAGVTHVYIHNIGPYQEEFINWFEKEVRPKLQ